MRYVHEDPEFDSLLRIVAENRGFSVALVEKDYWVTHTLWALSTLGFEIWFKGGTSLSKGFGCIFRFSEDLDLRIDPDANMDLPLVSSWKSQSRAAVASRHAYYQRLTDLVAVPGAAVRLDTTVVDPTWRAANILVEYPGLHMASLGVMSPFVRLEVGDARVIPNVRRTMTSFVHDELGAQKASFIDNQPSAIRCLHPLVTLVEKLDALQHRFPRPEVEAASFVRHFEDSAQIINSLEELPALPDFATVRELVEEMLVQKNIRRRPDPQDPAFAPSGLDRWRQLETAHGAISPMFWGPRLSLQESCHIVSSWLAQELGRRDP